MHPFADKALLYGHAASEALAEVLWPTRCAVCDAPGEVLCDACRRRLPYLDWWRACPACGAPYGRVQCTECNRTMLSGTEYARPPFASCASAVVYAEGAPRIIRAYKDHGERRLAADIARIMLPAAHPTWLAEAQALTAVPATAKARRHRGFDHMAEIAKELSSLTGIPLVHPFARPRNLDQRGLGRAERMANLAGRIRTTPGASIPRSILLIDDVYTTGATLFSASEALAAAGAKCVRCLTFARVW